MKLNSYGAAPSENISVYAAKEAYRTVRTNLMFSLAKSGCKVILFSSSIQAEGKTTSAANVAFSLARSEKKVLLIDGDLRSPRVHRLVKKPNSPGLTNFLSGFSSLEEVCHRQIFPNLDVICAGTISPNPSEMIASEGLSRLLADMQKHYDFIIIDTPPINPVSDALALVGLADGVVMVVRPGYTTRKDLRAALSQIEFVGGKVLGVIANGVQVEKKSAYGKKGYGYGRYGDLAAQAKAAPAPTLPKEAPAPKEEATETEEVE